MRTGLITKKIGMSSFFTEAGDKLAVTLLQLDNCQVVGQKTIEKDGYNAVILGASDVKPTKVSKSVRTVFEKNKITPKGVIREFRVEKDALLEVGATMSVDQFEVGQYVDAITEQSQGKGFAGVMKRHNFAGLRASHGVSISHRSHGSTGGCQDPGRVFKNKKMAGQMGNHRVTAQNLQIVDIDAENNILVVKGAVPGSKNGMVLVRDAVKKGAGMKYPAAKHA